MNLVPVKSNHIHSIGYDKGIMHVKFKNGSTYQYHGVTSQIHYDLMKAKSKGAHFNKHIRNNHKTIKL